MTWKQLAALATAGSFALIVGAYLFQALGYAPCKLCWWQRYPHFVALAIGALALSLSHRALAWLGALAALTTAGIGVYHSGVERGMWEGPTSCTSSSVANLSADELLDHIMTAPLVRCDDIPWELFGFTMANLNAILSFGLALLWIMAARKAS
ncbi:MAG: disulfide bond formation protein B [Maritimibacter sp.]